LRRRCGVDLAVELFVDLVVVREMWLAGDHVL
jgi:hypothetical protein